MGLFSWIFKKEKKKENKVKEEVEKETGLTELEKLCIGDLEVFDALKDTMFLNPRKIDISLEDAVSKAKELEKAKDTLRAAIWYKIAGGLAIYEGNVSKVKECFSKYAELTKIRPKILEIPDKAVKRAQEYYKKYL